MTRVGSQRPPPKKKIDICIGVGEDIENENVTHEKIKKRKTKMSSGFLNKA
jgi:hypothetical protein